MSCGLKSNFIYTIHNFFLIIREKDLAKRPCLIITWKEPSPLPKKTAVFAYNKIWPLKNPRSVQTTSQLPNYYVHNIFPTTNC